MLSPYVVRQGDYLTKLAFLYGFSAEEVWNDPQNDPIRSQRGDMDVLLPGDVVFIPPPSREPLPLVRGATNTYVAAQEEVTVSLVLRAGDQPLAREPFEARVPGEPIRDVANGQGRITFTVPAYVGRVDVFLPQRNEIYPVLIGHMDPETTRSGATARLASLGYFGNFWDDDVLRDDEAYRRALLAFQRDHGDDFGLARTGTLDAATSAALRATHGS
jgi:hypothetical protein